MRIKIGYLLANKLLLLFGYDTGELFSRNPSKSCRISYCGHMRDESHMSRNQKLYRTIIGLACLSLSLPLPGLHRRPHTPGI